MIFSWYVCVGLLADDHRLQTGQRGTFGGGDDWVGFRVVGNLQNVEESSLGVGGTVLFIPHGQYILLMGL